MKMNENIKKLYKSVFHQEAEEEKIQALVDLYGEWKVENVLQYYLINGVIPPGEGKRNNPYGLLFNVCRDWACIGEEKK